MDLNCEEKELEDGGREAWHVAYRFEIIVILLLIVMAIALKFACPSSPSPNDLHDAHH
jgi:hypothetical protein